MMDRNKNDGLLVAKLLVDFW